MDIHTEDSQQIILTQETAELCEILKQLLEDGYDASWIEIDRYIADILRMKDVACELQLKTVRRKAIDTSKKLVRVINSLITDEFKQFSIDDIKGCCKQMDAVYDSLQTLVMESPDPRSNTRKSDELQEMSTL